MAKPLPLKDVERQTSALLTAGLPVDDLRAQLETLAKEWTFSSLAWLWGPALYRLDRVRFRPFILAHWGGFFDQGLIGLRPVAWSGAIGQDLDHWFAEVDRLDDIELFRRLLAVKYTDASRWRPDSKALLADLRARLDQAPSPARVRIALEKFDIWGCELTEEAALDLYRRNRSLAGPFILKHLPWSPWSGGGQRTLWERLIAAAIAAGDARFGDQLYQRQVPLARWRKDALEACDQVHDAGELCALLERRHPKDQWRNLANPFLELIEKRGRDVLPYVGRHLRQVWSPWLIQGSYGRLVALARQRGWWDLWSAVVRTCARAQDFNAEVRGLLDQRLAEATARERLLMLAGVGREWNGGGFSAAHVQQLDDATAVALHVRFPDLLRGPWKLHVQVSSWGPGLPMLVERAVVQDDTVLIDFLASRLATRQDRWGSSTKWDASVAIMASYFDRLRQADEAAFGRRAIAVLGQIPAFAIHGYDRLIRGNRLARLIFERSHADFLAEPRHLSDLVEAPEIHVQALAYRILALADDRARAAAVANLDVLIGTLLRPLHRTTRLAAFAALANATHDPAAAARILARAREALDLPDQKYPKEQLVGLIATALHRQPGLRAAGEQPMVYRKAAS